MKTSRLVGTVCIIAAILCSAPWALADPFTISGSSNPSAYTLSYNHAIIGTPVPVTTPAGPWVQGAWMGPQPDQAWPMGPNSGSLPGEYNYTTTFDLSGLNPSTAVLKGGWATDDPGILYLNDIKVATSGGYLTLSYFSIDSGFISGTNYLSFVVTNIPFGASPGVNPTGLLVNFSEASATPVPEPTTMLLLGLGLIGVVGLRRKFQRV